MLNITNLQRNLDQDHVVKKKEKVGGGKDMERLGSLLIANSHMKWHGGSGGWRVYSSKTVHGFSSSASRYVPEGGGSEGVKRYCTPVFMAAGFTVARE